MTDETIAKLAAQALQARRQRDLNLAEEQLCKTLVEAGYLRPPSNGFVGTITDKAMLRHALYPTFEPLHIPMRRGSERNRGIVLE